MKFNIQYKKSLFLTLFLLSLFGWNAEAWVGDPEETPVSLTVTGTVYDSEGMSLPGVTILIEGTERGTVSDIDGKYEIEVQSDGVLIFSYVGYSTQEIPVQNRSVIDVTMEESAAALDEIVVTALGIQREEKSLGYSVERIGGDNIQRVAQENVLNALSGKVAGVAINSTGGAGSSVNMVIRGATSLSTDNQPLFVIDGVPMSSGMNNVGGFGDDNKVDYGNAIADLNPDDIEDISILKGPSAAALYGTRAGNGVVLVTTKKAVEGQPMKISVSSNTVFDIPYKYLNVQSQFSSAGPFSFRPEDIGGGILPPVMPAEGLGPENDKGYWAVQWGAPKDANGVEVPTELRSYPNNVRNFLNDYALTTTNTATISNSSQFLNYRLSYTNMTHDGIIPNSDLNRNNVNLSASSKLQDKLTISTNINFSNSFAKNRPATANRGTNPLQAAYWVPTNTDIRSLEDYGSGSEVLKVHEKQDNPYFLAHEVNNSFDRYRIYGNVAATWDISPNWELMGRFSMNKSDQNQESKIPPGYTNEPNNGSYGISNSNSFERNIDALLTYSKDWNFLTWSASAGGNLRYAKGASTSSSSKSGVGLVVPNVFTIQNIQSSALSYSNSRNERAIHSVYGMTTLGFGGMAYLDLTARNDWSSTLPAANRSYFYPSASLSLLVDQMVNLGRGVDMLKLRGGVAQVGNDTGPYKLTATYGNSGQWGDAIRLNKSGGLLSPNLLPEEATSIEYGLDLIMFSNRLRFEGTYYTVDNKNQILGVPLATSTGFSSVQVNAGLLQSKGYEVLLGVTPVKTKDWELKLDVNFTNNSTVILDLADEIDFIQPWDAARVRNMGFVKDESKGRDGNLGNLYVRKVMRVKDESSPYYGFPILMNNEYRLQGEEDYTLAGNYNPDFIMGLQSGLRYKNFSLNMTFDWRSGGKFVSQTMRYLANASTTQVWLDELVHPGELGGKPGKELRDWVMENKEELILSPAPNPIGGPSPEYGGFPEDWSSAYTVYDGVFIPGVYGEHDENGKFNLRAENLGDEGTVFIPYSASHPWDAAEVNIFDADYMKLREISLNYQFPKRLTERWGLGNLNVSVYSRNIMLWTKNSPLNVDPERAFQAESGGGFSQGVERYNVEPWMMPIGFKIGLDF